MGEGPFGWLCRCFPGEVRSKAVKYIYYHLHQYKGVSDQIICISVMISPNYPVFCGYSFHAHGPSVLGGRTVFPHLCTAPIQIRGIFADISILSWNVAAGACPRPGSGWRCLREEATSGDVTQKMNESFKRTFSGHEEVVPLLMSVERSSVVHM